MDNNKSRVLTRVLWCLLFIVLAIVICYLVYSCRLLNANELNLNSFCGNKYLSADSGYYVAFSEDAATLTINTPEYDYSGVTINDYYDNMFFFILDGEDYVIAAIDDATLFLSNARVYLYLLN